jgi:ureidoacrylate peracid hydrolase
MSRAQFAKDGKGGLTRHVAIQTIHHTALLVVDVQNYTSVPGIGEFSHIDHENIPDDLRYHFNRLESTTLPAIKRLQDACRASGVEVMYTVVEALTQDMRDLGLDYKISGIGVPKGSDLAELPPSVARLEDEIIIGKTSSNVFMSTNIDYVLRALEVEQLIICGLLTDQCVESAVRDACDLGYLVTVPEDACATMSQERHDQSLGMYKGYCRIVSADQVAAEIQTLARQAAE